MRRALLVVHTSTFFPRMLEVGQMLKRSGRYEPVFYLADYPAGKHLQIAHDLEVLRAEKLSYVNPVVSPMGDLTPSPRNGSPADGNRPAWRRLAKRLLGHLPKPVAQKVKQWGVSVLTWGPGSILYHCRYLTGRLQFVTHLIRQEKPAILVLALDIAPYDTAVFVKAAHKEHIRAVVVASLVGLGEEWAEVYQYDPTRNMQRWPNRFAGALYPRWVHEHKGRKFLLMPAGPLLAREWLGLAPPLPWIVGSGYADAIAIENEVMYQRGVLAGLPPDQLVLTGWVAQDVMAETLKQATGRRAALYRRLNLPLGRPMILSALTPPYHGRKRPNPVFQNYGEFVQFWVQSLVAIEGYNVVISLHPSMKYEDMAYIEQWGVRIARQRTPDLVPLCDIYVASQCTTISWAIACGKPVIIYDVGRYRFALLYAGVEGVITVEEKEEFLSVLQRLTKDPAFYAEVAARQAACAGQWGQLDGQAGQRMLQLFDRLVEQYHS